MANIGVVMVVLVVVERMIQTETLKTREKRGKSTVGAKQIRAFRKEIVTGRIVARERARVAVRALILLVCRIALRNTRHDGDIRPHHHQL
jgi:hypothetical protein